MTIVIILSRGIYKDLQPVMEGCCVRLICSLLIVTYALTHVKPLLTAKSYPANVVTKSNFLLRSANVLDKVLIIII